MVEKGSVNPASTHGSQWNGWGGAVMWPLAKTFSLSSKLFDRASQSGLGCGVTSISCCISKSVKSSEHISPFSSLLAKCT